MHWKERLPADFHDNSPVEDFMSALVRNHQRNRTDKMMGIKRRFLRALYVTYMIPVVQRCLFLYSEEAENLKVGSPADLIWC